ncbi:hypothetical protein ABZV31_30780, partial [Streptomyces sp. NPDC005202]|uniref:hypothetical protein n=1 Tax=Streptomyces sp. NPDC005202 TaxID=3157021 RepID=UPI0033BF2B94
MGMYVPSIAEAVVENRRLAAGPATVCKRADAWRSSRRSYAESENGVNRRERSAGTREHRAGPGEPGSMGAGPGRQGRVRVPGRA